MAQNSGWGATVPQDDISHIYPLGDIRDHDVDHELEDGTLSLYCWCEPCYANGSAIHHSADMREMDEHNLHACNQKAGEA